MTIPEGKTIKKINLAELQELIKNIPETHELRFNQPIPNSVNEVYEFTHIMDGTIPFYVFTKFPFSTEYSLARSILLSIVKEKQDNFPKQPSLIDILGAKTDEARLEVMNKFIDGFFVAAHEAYHQKQFKEYMEAVIEEIDDIPEEFRDLIKQMKPQDNIMNFDVQKAAVLN
jgi:hypothetical protein